jgi:hypothetical protein
MKRYKMLKIMNLNSGRVELNDNQYKRRAHALKHVHGNVYEIAKAIQFKVGEEFGYDGEIPKRWADCIEIVSDVHQTEQKSPRHVGAGVFELPDGTRVKGKDAAQAAMNDQ